MKTSYQPGTRKIANSSAQISKAIKERNRLDRLMRNAPQPVRPPPPSPVDPRGLGEYGIRIIDDHTGDSMDASTTKPRIFDCFTLFNELDIMELRLMELDSAVDRFIVVEANKTHTGKDKPYHFEDNKARFEKWLHKITYVKVDDLPSYNHNQAPKDIDWKPENHQRNAIMRGVNGVATKGDKIIISDLDEIWDKTNIAGALSVSEPVVFAQSMFYYYVNTMFPTKWFGSIMATYGNFDTPQSLRNMRVNIRNIVNPGGWHYSYQGGVDLVKAKMDNIAEANLMVDRMGTVEKIQDKLATLIDPLERGKLLTNDVYKPGAMEEFLQKYPQYLYRG